MSNVGASGNFDSEIRTPDAFYNDDTVLSDIHELNPSVGDLGFLDQDDDSPNGLRGTPEIGTFPQNQSTPELPVPLKGCGSVFEKAVSNPYSRQLG
ncbi:hypothetical protein C2S52_021182 [Perilla frutescens var. hirtella]|nr:hypothetical protein C2S52_021182 [Perilla frutescens var. hirtella]